MANTIRVLHVEDEPDFADLTRSYLERELERIDLVHAESGRMALEKLKTREFDCVVSDYDMPETTGIEILEEAREIQPYVPFILFTGQGSEDVASDAISAGVTDYLQKGGTETYALLANSIENAVSQSRLQQFQSTVKHDPLSLVDRFSDPLFALNRSWEFTFANEAAEERFDCPSQELLGQPIWELFPEAKETPFYDQ